MEAVPRMRLSEFFSLRSLFSSHFLVFYFCFLLMRCGRSAGGESSGAPPRSTAYTFFNRFTGFCFSRSLFILSQSTARVPLLCLAVCVGVGRVQPCTSSRSTVCPSYLKTLFLAALPRVLRDTRSAASSPHRSPPLCVRSLPSFPLSSFHLTLPLLSFFANPLFSFRWVVCVHLCSRCLLSISLSPSWSEL